MSPNKPSLYPNVEQQQPSNNVYPPAPAPPSESLGASPYDNISYDNNSSFATAPPPPHSHSQVDTRYETLPPEYELLLEVEARVTEIADSNKHTNTLKKSKIGILRVVQGPLPPLTPEEQQLQQQNQQAPAYHAFISIDDVNIPLLSTYGSSRVNETSFYISIPSRTFLVELNEHTEVELIEAFEKLLKWFCQFQIVTDNGIPSSIAPQGIILNENNGLEINNEYSNNTKKSSIEYINRAGDKGVELVEKYGSLINEKINNQLERKKTKVIEEQQQGVKSGKQIKLGGKFTNSLLLTTRKVIGSGANIASKVTDNLSSRVSNAMSSSSVSRNLANAPDNTMKRKFYDHFMAGALVFGRLYVETDRQSKIIISDAGDRMSEIANHKYGSEAEMAARNLSGIALDGYRISRFPQKLGATSMVKGAFKSKFAKDSHLSTSNDSHMQASNAPGVARHPHSYAGNPYSDYGTRGHRPGNAAQFNDISED